MEELGRFILFSVKTEAKGQRLECKDCEAVGLETMLGQKYLELFTVNMGTTESIDGVKFYNLSNPDKSLLHLVLEKCPDWTLGHIDTSLMTMERCFEVTRQDVYSFLTKRRRSRLSMRISLRHLAPKNPCVHGRHGRKRHGHFCHL